MAGQTDQNALRAVDERSMAGKVLHVDRSGRGLPGHPFCPDDDDLTHVCTKVYAKGFRNPYRFVLRDGGRGPVVGDVGMSAWDEIDLIQPGGSYGWPCWEGPAHQPTWEADPACQATYPGGNTPPDLAYAGDGGASGGGNAVVGGPVYPGGDYPSEFTGEILFGDWSQGFIKRLRLTDAGPVTQDFVSGAQVLDLQLAPSGNLAFVNTGYTPGAGALYEIGYCPVNCAPIARARATPLFGEAPLEVAFDGDGSTDPDGDARSFDWDFGDGSPHSALASPVHEYVSDGVYSARLTVTDPAGLASTATIPISAGNTPPEPAIAAPAEGTLYTAGRAIGLKGSALDAEEGAIDPEKLEWRVTLHHGSHVHPFTVLTGATAEVTPPADHGVDSFLEVTLSARDGDGASGSKTIELHARPVTVRLDSEPPGAPLVWGSAPVTAPYTTLGADGMRTSVAAGAALQRGGRSYAFDSWSDGGAAAHDVDVAAAAPLHLVARYRPVAAAPADKTGPKLEFDPRRAVDRARSGRVAGGASDPAGVRGVEVALRARDEGGRCRWWRRDLGRLARRARSCEAPRWMRARLRPRKNGRVWWRVFLDGAARARDLEAVVRGHDRLGNMSRSPAGGTYVRLHLTRSPDSGR